MISQIKQLEAQLAQETVTKDRIDLMSELSWQLCDVDRTRAQDLCTETLQLSMDEEFSDDPYIKGIAQSLIVQGYLDFRGLVHSNSLANGIEAIRLIKQLGNYSWLPRAYNIVTINYARLGHVQKALYFLDEQSAFSNELEDREQEATALHNMGVLNLESDSPDLPKARDYFEMSLPIYEAIDSEQGFISAHASLARIEIKEANPEQALCHCQLALDKCIEYGYAGPEALVLTRMGEAKELLGQLDEAERLFIEGLAAAKKSSVDERIYNAHLGLGKLYCRKDAFNDALNHLEQALSVCNLSSNLGFQVEVHAVLATLFFKQGNFKQAYDHTKTQLSLRELVYAEQRQQQAEQFETLNHLELASKDVEIFQLKNQKLKQMVEERTQRLAEKTADLQRTNLALEDASKRKDIFLATISHELRTPLNVIMTRAQALQLGVYGAINDSQQTVLKGLLDGSDHLLSLINDVLDVSKISSGNEAITLVPHVLNPIVQASVNAIQPIATTKNLNVILNLEKDSPIIYCDSRRIKQIITNLLSNAVKFTPNGGRVEIIVSTEETQVVICVVDSGIGISESDQAILFEPFVQADSRLSRNYEGTGLGLSLVKQLAELHGGRVMLESELSVGSKFYVYLPIDSSLQTVIVTKTKDAVKLVSAK